MNTVTKRISRGALAVLLILCTLLSPLSGIITAQAAGSVTELEGTELNGAKVLDDKSKYLNTVSYLPANDNGYKASIYNRGWALQKNGVGTPFVSFYIDTPGEGGSVLKGASKYNGYDAYGFIAGSGDSTVNESVAVKLKYNFSSTSGLSGADGHTWSVNSDSWKKEVNGISSVGVVGKGAVIVQKFVPTADKKYPYSSADWKRLNEFSGKETYGLHTVDFFSEYSPSERTSPFTVYTPSGKDLAKGVFVKLTVAYELKRTETEYILGFIPSEKTRYKNVVEETVFYLCNTSAEIVFENLYFEDADAGEEPDSSTDQDNGGSTSAEQKGGVISNNQGSIDGFKVDMRGWNYNVRYRFNNSSNLLTCSDGQIFTDPGKYEFVIKTNIGVVRTKTVYIHEKTKAKNVETYFGKGLVSQDSVRIFAPAETYPVYMQGTVTLRTPDLKKGEKGVTHAPLAGKVYLMNGDWNDVKRDEYGLPLESEARLIAEKPASSKAWSFSQLPAGNYEAIFVNNADYFKGTDTGDTYKFVWRFTIVEGGQAPIVNQELLYQQLGFSDYESGFYAVRLDTKGEGDVLVAFTDEDEAYGFACRYFVGRVEKRDSDFVFEGVTYRSEEAMLTVLRERARSLVERRYYDINDPDSYLTLKENVIFPVLGETPSEEEQKEYDEFVGVLDREIPHDVVIFPDEVSREDAAIGEPFLNDRVYAVLDGKGEIELGANPVYFISVADYESSSVTLYREGSDDVYSIPYGVAVQQYLEDRNALSGRYKIVESSTAGTVEYYAVYVRPGDNTSSVTLERVYNNNSVTVTLSKPDNGKRLRANNFRITDIYNELDPYGIITVKKYGGEARVYEITEYENIPEIDEEGNYEITLTDRLGNSFFFFVDIYVAKKNYSFSLIDGEETVFSEKAHGGKVFELPTPESRGENFIFIGWKDSEGEIFNGSYEFNSPADVTLEALWHYSSVTVEVYDGELVASYKTRVEATQALPSIARDGFILYGYRYVDENGAIRFYRAQVSQVPNVPYMRLDAVWRRVEDEDIGELPRGEGDVAKLSLIDGTVYGVLDAPKGGVTELPKPLDSDGMTFMGWLYEYRLAGMIFTDKFSYTEANTVGMADGDCVKLTAVWTASADGENTAPQGILTAGGNGGGGLTDGGGSSALSAVIGGALGGFLAALVALAVLFRKRIAAVFDTFVSICKNGQFCRRVFVPTVCFLLAVITLYTSTVETAVSAAEVISEAVAAHKEDEAIEEAQEERNRQLLSAFDTVGSVFDESLTETQEFLYGNIIVDLIAMGYEDVFTAYVLVGEDTPDTSDDRRIDGIGYTAYLDAYEEGDGHVFGAGFVSLMGEDSLTLEEGDSGLKVYVCEDEADYYDYTVFRLTANRVWGPSHYVAYKNYVTYSVMNYVVQYTAVSDTGVYNESLGDVFSYDTGEYCHFVDYGNEIELDAYGITSDLDYDNVLETYREAMDSQLQNSVEINVEKADFISFQAMNDYIAHNCQDERLLGVDAETLLYYEANIADTQYYIIRGDGSVEVLDVPPDRAGFWERLITAAVAVGGAILGVVCCSIPGVGPVLGGAIISAAIDVFMQVTVSGVPVKDVNWKSVCVSAITGALTGGIGAGGQAIAKAAIKESMKAVTKFFIGLGVEVAAGMLGGAVTSITTAVVNGEALDFGECMKSMALGAATGAIIFAGGQALSAIAKKSSTNWLSKLSDSNVGIVVGGALSGMGSYLIAIGLTGEPFSVQALLLAMGMGAATATLVIVGKKIASNVKSAYQKRQENVAKNKQYKNYETIEGGVKHYYDDNGNLYRVGDDLAPNSEYEMNGYKYKTDADGRVTSVEGDLYIKESGRKNIKDNIKKIGKGSQQPKDHRGHLIGDRFGGGNGLENIVAQNGSLNQGDYKALENKWAAALDAGKEVNVNIKVNYRKGSHRPSSFTVEYTIDGVPDSKVFLNQ